MRGVTVSCTPQEGRKAMIEHEVTGVKSEVTRLNDDMEANFLTPLWQIEEATMPLQPRPKAVAWLWKWSDLYDIAQRSGRLVPVARGRDRRAIALRNPGLGGQPFATPTLWAAVQWVNGHDVAPAHRHTAQAVRFIINGSGPGSPQGGGRGFFGGGGLLLNSPR